MNCDNIDYSFEEKRSLMLEKICTYQNHYIALLENERKDHIKMIKEEESRNQELFLKLREAENDVMSVIAHRKAHQFVKAEKEYRKKGNFRKFGRTVADGEIVADGETVTDGDDLGIPEKPEENQDTPDSLPPKDLIDLYRQMSEETFSNL